MTLTIRWRKSKILNCYLRMIALLAIISVLSSFFTCSHPVQAQDPQNFPLLREANDALQDAFGAILEAEQSEAGVTALLDTLRVGSDILTEAEIAYRIGDTIEMTNKIESALEVFSEVETEAMRAKDLAIAGSMSTVFSRVVILVLGEFFYVFVLFLIWKRFRRFYAKKSLNSNLR